MSPGSTSCLEPINFYEAPPTFMMCNVSCFLQGPLARSTRAGGAAWRSLSRCVADCLHSDCKLCAVMLQNTGAFRLVPGLVSFDCSTQHTRLYRQLPIGVGLHRASGFCGRRQLPAFLWVLTAVLAAVCTRRLCVGVAGCAAQPRGSSLSCKRDRPHDELPPSKRGY